MSRPASRMGVGFIGSSEGQAGYASGPRPVQPLDQIVVARNRQRRSTDRVNLVYTFVVERIHTFDRVCVAIPIKRDPL